MKVTQLEQLYRDGMSRLKEQKKRQEQGRLEQTVKRLSQEQKALYEKKLQDVVFSLCSRLDPPVKVEPVKGKTLDTRAPEMVALEGWRDEVAAVVPVVEENALAVFGNHQMPVFLKGVGENYAQVHTRLDETLLDGEFMLNDTAGCYIALGAGVASRLETGPFFSRPIRIYSPRRNVRVNMANPSSSFRERETFA